MFTTLKEHICQAREMPRNDEIILARAELLAPIDRDIIEMVIIRGQSIVSVARIMGITPRALRGRVERLTQKINSERFLDTARALPYLPRQDAELARMCYCQGVSYRELSRRFEISQYGMRRRLDSIWAEIQTIRRVFEGGGSCQVEDHSYLPGGGR